MHSCLLVILAPFFKSRKFEDKVMIIWAKIMLALVNTKVHVTGRENIPKEGCIYLFNHTSHFDIPLAVVALQTTVRFGAKIELYKIPIFGRSLKVVGMLPIVRSNREKVLRIYKRSVEKVLNENMSYILAPEGTRQKDASRLGRFKQGPFIFALAGKIPLVPVVIEDAELIMPKENLLPGSSQWRYNISVKILPKIETKDYTNENIKELIDKTREIMVKEYKTENIK